MSMPNEICEGCELEIEVVGVERVQEQVGIGMHRIPNLIINIKGACGLDDDFYFKYNRVVGNDLEIRKVVDDAQQNTGIIKYLKGELTNKGRCRIFDHSDITRA